MAEPAHKPTITPLDYTYKKPDGRVWVLNFDDIPLPAAPIEDRQVVHFAAAAVGGNHKHPRTEWFIAFGPLEFVWLDAAGKQYTEDMNPEGKLLIIEVPPFLPHAVRNRSSTESAVLLEFADAKMNEMERVAVV